MRRLLPLCLAFATVTGPAAAADDLTSVLEGVDRAIILPVVIDQGSADAQCGLSSEAVTEAVLAPVRSAGLDADVMGEAAPFDAGTPGVYLIPTVATIVQARFNCVSWIGLRAQAGHTMTMPGTDLRKTAQILFWDRGALLSNPINGHAEAVDDVFVQMAVAFGEAWRADQSGIVEEEPAAAPETGPQP